MGVINIILNIIERKNKMNMYTNWCSDVWIAITEYTKEHPNANELTTLLLYSMLKDENFIFGGAIRDSIARLPIHDIDVISFGTSASKLVDQLVNLKFTQEKTSSMDLQYKDIKIIHAPVTLVYNTIKIQIIRPHFDCIKFTDDYNERKKLIKRLLLDFVGKVDLSPCALAYGITDGEDTVYELYDGALMDAFHRRYRVFFENDLYHRNRIVDRILKLQSRGWTYLNI